MPEASEETPIYTKVQHDEPSSTALFFIVVDEGWRESILCERMYEWAADWLIEILQGKPFTKSNEKE